MENVVMEYETIEVNANLCDPSPSPALDRRGRRRIMYRRTTAGTHIACWLRADIRYPPLWPARSLPNCDTQLSCADS